MTWHRVDCLLSALSVVVYRPRSCNLCRMMYQHGHCWSAECAGCVLVGIPVEYVCVFSHKAVFSTRRHPAQPMSVPALQPYNRKGTNYRYVVTKQRLTDTTRYQVCRNAVGRVDDAMPCHRTEYDRHNIRILAPPKVARHQADY